MGFGFSEGMILGDRYRLERVLGAGGMASVWLARDERLNRLVALKLLSDTLIADPAYLSRFRREARLAAALSHPNLVKVYDFGGEGERPYLAMEYIEGETLAHHISAGSATVEFDSASLTQGLLGALEHIHGAGIIHRDIKPANVMVTRQGAVKVTDFGIAQPEDATRLTSTGLVVGTRSYMAPEVLRGEPATARSDLYSCGVVLKEASGEHLPPYLDRLTASLADDDPAQRPESASEAMAGLAMAGADPTAPTERLPSGAAMDAPTATVNTQARPLPMRWLGVAAFLVALTIAGIALLSGGESPDDRTSRDAQQGKGGTQNPGSDTSAPEPTTEEATEEATDEGTSTSEPPATDPAETTEPVPAPSKTNGAKPTKGDEPPGKAKGLKKDKK